MRLIITGVASIADAAAADFRRGVLVADDELGGAGEAGGQVELQGHRVSSGGSSQPAHYSRSTGAALAGVTV
jgi:hypothetical protein